MKIREAAKGHSELVAVLYGSPHFLTELSPDTRDKIILDGFQRFAPDGWAKIQHGQELTGLAAKYPDAISKVHLFFYNRELASQANRRVEI